MALAVLTSRVRKNGANGNSVITVLEGELGQFEDVANSDAFVETDEMNVLNITAGTSGAINVVLAGMMITLPATATFAARVMVI